MVIGTRLSRKLRGPVSGAGLTSEPPASPSFATTRRTTQQFALGGTIGLLAGLSSGVFLVGLDAVTHTRESLPLLVFGLPIAGFLMGWAQDRWGTSVIAGNNLVIDRINSPGPPIPLRMAPMVLVGTLITHLFGGSAGREGTAVQMGASLASNLTNRLRLGAAERQELLAAGVAGGFGAVFGTPLAGTVFGMEMATIGRMETRALLPALSAAVVGDLVVRTMGVSHTPFPSVSGLALDPSVLLRLSLFAVAIGLFANLFIRLSHLVSTHTSRWMPRRAHRLAAGGGTLLGLHLLFARPEWLGLSLPTLLSAFRDPNLDPTHVFGKLTYTALTIGTGFPGGEVTPLFVIGACLGNGLSGPLDLPIGMAAAIGMAAMFGAAANTPFALTLMAVELFGAEIGVEAAWVCTIAWLVSGPHSIYPAQRTVQAARGDPPKPG